MKSKIVAGNEVVPTNLAGVGSRLMSFLIDTVILMILVSLVFMITSMDSESLDILGGLIQFAYYVYFFGKSQTPGMMAMKIKLVGSDGAYPIGYSKGFLRFWGLEISAFVLFLGFVWILIDKKRQGRHDKIAGTYVVTA